MNEKRQMKPVNFNRPLFEKRTKKVDPAYREITEGLNTEIQRILRDPDKLAIGCCIEGCCVSWCCIQMV
jgi:hypothetical protein